MSEKKTQHYRDDQHFERRDVTRSDGSRHITESKVCDTPLGRAGSNIVTETEIDRNGNSRTTTNR